MNELDEFVLQSLPHFIAVEYQSLLDADSSESKVRHALRVYQLGLRALTIGVVSQYLIRDANRVNDPDLNHLLGDKLQFATIDTWQKILVTSLKAYQGLRSLFFMPELYDFFWDSSFPAPQPRPDIEKAFTRLTQIYNDVEFSKGHIDWPILCDETLGLLRELLGHLDFFQNYELICVIKREEDQYWCERYTGLEVDSTPLTFRTEHDLSEGWFYLAKQNQDFLNLHPLLIFWEDSQLEPVTTTITGLQQFAIYERFVSDRLQYLLTCPWKTVMDDKSVADFVRLIYYTLEQIKGEIPETDRLTWEQLWTIARAVSSQRMASVLDKYNPNLYLKRDNTTTAFEEFLASDKVCFVLTGKSGVGKSNFLLALADEYNQIHPEICLLMYNGAKMAADKPLAATIGQDFNNHLRLTRPDKPDQITNIWQEITAIDDMAGHQVILFIDAINENPEAKALLHQIDDLVESSLWPWLKVVITSRPEAWRTIKRGVKLAETRYYRATGEEQLGIEMQPFSYSQQLESFTRDELPRAYTKYQAVYHLQTAFSDLSAEVKASLQDPLVLRLIAVTYHDRAIPATIKISQIYQNYIDHLIASERLALEDARFLEQELLPLMLHEGHYANTLTGQEIDMARTTGGHSLFELIHGEGMLSSGQRVNQSYINLVDTEILVRHGTGRDYEIGFKYERFYDFFAGQRLRELIQQRGGDRKIIYRNFVIQLRDYPFLWGSIKTALMVELSERNTNALIDLAQIADDTTRQLVVAALSDYGKDNPQIIQPVLENLVSMRESRTEPAARQKKQHKDISPELFTARKVAIETATNLMMTGIVVTAACDSSSSVRMYAVQHVRQLWNQNDQVGLETLLSLRQRIKNKLGVPRLAVIESIIGASVLVVLEHYKEPATTRSLQQLWQSVLDQLLFIRNSETRPWGNIIKRIRGIAISLIIRQLVGFTRLLLSGTHLNYDELNHFIHLPLDEKSRFERLLPYLDADYGNLDDIRDDLIALGSARDILTINVVYFILSIRGSKCLLDILPFLPPMFEQALHLNPPAPMTLAAPATLRTVLLLSKQSEEDVDDALDLLDKLVWEYYERSTCTYWTDKKAYQQTVIDGLILCQYLLRGTNYPDSLIKHLAKDKDLKQFTLHRLFVGPTLDKSLSADITSGLLDVLTAYGYPALALKYAKLLIEVDDEITRKGICKFLARLRASEQDEVDDFIEEFKLNPDEVREAQATISTQGIGDLLGVIVLPLMLELQSQPVVFREVRALLAGMIECKSVVQLIELLVKRTVNFIYGSVVFDKH